MLPILYLIIPCYNEEEVLPVTEVMFRNELTHLISCGKIHGDSRIMYIDDGSKDRTWQLIGEFAGNDSHVKGICLSRNRGHQNAVLAGLLEAKSHCDVTITIDCDGQDDITAAERMIDEYNNGAQIVYGVRSDRKSDTFLKRFTAESYYRFLSHIGAETVYNHADYRLVSSRVLDEFADFREVNLYLRGLFPMIGFKSAQVYYSRHERIAGKSRYPLKKMLLMAADGITSLTVYPIRLILRLGIILAAIGFVGVAWTGISALCGSSEWGIAGMSWLILLTGGFQLTAIGIVGEYVGKTYLESKHRPRYIISDRI